MAYSLKCPVCRKKFPWNPTEGMPDDCALCGAVIGGGDDNVISMPAIRTAVSKATDKVYRDIEAASEVRAAQAAEVAGVPVSEMSGLKITDLRPTTHHGDVAAPLLTGSAAALEQHMTAMNANGAHVGFGSNGLGYSGAVASGPHRNAGAFTQKALREVHPNLAGANIGTGERGQPVAPSHDVMSDRMANEMSQPGYRWRV